MKKHISLIFLIVIVFNINAQAPQGFNYQGTVRDSDGNLVMNEDVSFKFNILQGSQTASPIYIETHLAPTDDLGQVTLVIGQGEADYGVFSGLDWSLGNYYLSIELDTGNGYVAMGTTQFLSVPYALYAENSGNSGSDTQGLMNFNYWSNYQVWNDNTTHQIEPNSFLFINANNTTLVFPQSSPDFGDVIYIYVMQEENTPRNVTLQVGYLPIGTPYGTIWGSQSGYLEAGLNTIINVGDYWMVASFTAE
tara:strand:+ start:162 stop:911 length:750 start_codon:yes stop_codon:yes gene_type:complete